MATNDGSGRVQELERGYHMGCIVPARSDSARGLAPNGILDAWVRLASDRERDPATLSGPRRLTRNIRDLVFRAQCRRGDRNCLRAPLLLRRSAELLSGTFRDAAAQYSPKGNLGGAQSRTATDRGPL